jgi:hypothetical protein
MVEDKKQIHYRIDTLLRYYGIRDEEKLLKYLKAQGQKDQPQSSSQSSKSIKA